MKKLSLLFLLLVGCATTDPAIIDIQQKILGDKYVKGDTHYFRFLDGTILVVDERTYHEFKVMQTVQLTWKKQ